MILFVRCKLGLLPVESYSRLEIQEDPLADPDFGFTPSVMHDFGAAIYAINHHLRSESTRCYCLNGVRN
jgi:hypothetical protein